MGGESYPFVNRNRNRLNARAEAGEIVEADCDWRESLRGAVREPAELARLLELPEASLAAAYPDSSSFPLLVPREFVARMQKGDPDDPLLRQVLPSGMEAIASAGFGPDPLAEQPLAAHGLIRKYAGRALLIATGACPVHCRYCFRREFPYSEQTAARDGFAPALAAIADAGDATEVILSGGDPLALGNARLGRLLAAIEAIPAIRSLRIHTRFPIVLPSRVDAGLVRLIAATRLDTVIVVHANHPAEIDATVVAAAARLRGAAQLLLNQAVLLRGVNDAVPTLIALGERLVHAGIAPYYLHLLDRVSGTAHFEVDEKTAVALIAAMRERAPGYLVPKLVRDRAGELSKTPVA
jgi:EF-P beta-lysylation protein EpmB